MRLINHRRKLVKQTMREVASELFIGQTRAEIAPQIVSYLHEHPGYVIGEASSYKGQDENGSDFFVRVVQFLAKKA